MSDAEELDELLEEWGVPKKSVHPPGYQPEAAGEEKPDQPREIWLSVAQEELDKLRAAHAGHRDLQKMVTTIIAIVDARLAGESETSVFKRKDTCNQTTYYRKWKADEAFAACLTNLTELARKWKDEKALRAVNKAAETIAILSQPAAFKLGQLLKSADESIRARVALGIIDRAGATAAGREAREVQVLVEKLIGQIDLNKLSNEQLARIGRGENLLMVLLGDYLSN